MITNWDQLAAFYRTVSSSNRAEYAEYGSHMLELVEMLFNIQEREKITAFIEKFDLVLYNHDLTSARIDISWENDSYKFSLNNFMDSQSIDRTRIIPTIVEYLSPIRENPIDTRTALRVFVDYNTISDDLKGRIHINTVVSKYLLSILQPGLPLVLFDDESLEVDAVAEFDSEHQCWYGVPDWSTRRELPPLSQEDFELIRKLNSL